MQYCKAIILQLKIKSLWIFQKKNSDSLGVSKHCRQAKPFWGRGQGWWGSSWQMFRPEMAARNCFPKSSSGSHQRKWRMTMGGVPTTKPLCEVAHSFPTLCGPMDCSPPVSSVHGIFQARILEWLPFPSPADLTNPGINPGSPALQSDSTVWAIRKPL